MRRRLGIKEIGRAHRAIAYLGEADTADYPPLEKQATPPNDTESGIIEVRSYLIDVPYNRIRQILQGKTSRVEQVAVEIHNDDVFMLFASWATMRHVIFHADHPYA